MLGRLFDLQKFCLHDGPGIRTTVFFKGCDNRCPWCHNPESLSGRPQIKYLPANCIGDGACVAACPRGAHSLAQGAHRYDPTLCTACGACAEVCYAGAMVRVGYEASPQDILQAALRDVPFYQTSGGGVTFSGGEPLLQSDFLAQCLRLCRQAGLHTAVETALNVPPEALEPILPLADLFLCDLKHSDDDVLRRVCGIDGARVRANLSRLSASGVPFWVRTPVAEGFNACADTIAALARQAALPGLVLYELLPLHTYAQVKYETLHMPADSRFTPPAAQTMEQLAAAAGRWLPRVVYDGKEFGGSSK
ncbi:MAG: glycyl-radical enzyme activating protein [Eubacteriales bacterium]|nr:glycyl-radical enzyme activating protein [Eubacteriales bacterium]